MAALKIILIVVIVVEVLEVAFSIFSAAVVRIKMNIIMIMIIKTTANNNNSKRLSLKQLCHYCQINLKSTQNLIMCVKQILSSIPIIQRKARTNIPSELNIWYKSTSIRSSLSSSSLSDTAGSKRMIELTWMDRRTQCDALSSVIHYLLSYQD